jgi:hypothetical protein
MIDPHFFTRVSAEDNKQVRHEAYKAKYARSTMVLYSTKTRTPLAALVFKAEDPGCLSLLTGRPTPGQATEPYFQGMLNMPDQVFTFSIVNLSDKGMINFNILHTPHRVSEVDPGPTYGINQVNELHPNQGYTIPADQRNNCKMVLAGKTRKNADGTDTKVTVKDTESKEQKEGLYFYLSVVAANSCPELVEKFAEGTVWKCSSHFVRKVKVPEVHLQSSSYRGGSGMRLLSRHAPPVTRGIRGPGQGPVHGDIPEGAYMSLGGFGASRGGDSGNRSMNESWRNQSYTVPESYHPEEEESEDGEADMDLFDTAPAPVFRSTGNAGSGLQSKGLSSTPLVSAAGFAAVDVGSTQAGSLTYGKQVEVRSGFTGEEYAYEHPSTPTVLCLSLYPEMKFYPLPDLDEAVGAELKEWMENEGKELLAALTAIYKADTCVIDLESPADTVVIQCGHQCLNHANVGDLRKCPMCRNPITALVKADGIVV